MPNEIIRQMCGRRKGLVLRCEQGILKWYGQLVRMRDERLVKRVFQSDVAGRRERGAPKRRWLDGVKNLLKTRRLDLDQWVQLAMDRKVWRGVVWGVADT